MQSRLSHQGKESHGFQRHSFAASVGACNDQQIKIVPQTNINGDDRFRINQRMAPFANEDAAFLIQ